MPTLRKIKRAAMQPHKPTQIAAHFILHNRTKANTPPRQILTLQNAIKRHYRIQIFTSNKRKTC